MQTFTWDVVNMQACSARHMCVRSCFRHVAQKKALILFKWEMSDEKYKYDRAMRLKGSKLDPNFRSKHSLYVKMFYVKKMFD